MEPEGIARLSLKPLDRKWKRGRILGIGGFSTVYLATREDDGLQFAVKSVAAEPRDDDETKALETLRNEIDLAQKLDQSKYIVQYFGHGLSESVKFGTLERRTLDIYLEYLPKGNLTSLVQWYWNNKRQIISEVWMATYILDILRALDYLHKNEIVHGDIKGENVLFGSKGMKLVDFGSSKDSSVSKLSLVLEGTKGYMAPEVESKVVATYASDIFSLGCVFLEMATGHPPCETLKDQEYAKPIPKNLSRDAEEFLKCCLKTNPNLRLSASQLLNHVFILDNTQLNNDPRTRLRSSNREFPYDCKYLDLRPSEDKCLRVQFVDTFRYSGPHSGSAHMMAQSGLQEAASPNKVISREEKDGMIRKLDIARASIGLDPQDQHEISKSLSEDSQNGGKFNMCCCIGRATNAVEPRTSPNRSQL